MPTMLRLTLGLLLAVTAAAQEPSFQWLEQPPAGLPAMPMPDGYQPTAAMFELGKRLFHDGILSSDRTVSCASCHPTPGFASPEPRPKGVGDKRAKLHAPSLFNRGYGSLQRWNGSSPSIEAFVLEPISDPNEMGLPLAEAIARLNAADNYRRQFEDTFGAAADAVTMQRALATFVRGIVRGDSPYDRFLRGDREAMTTLQRTGFWIFESKGGCWQCHTPGLFTDEKLHNTGIGARAGQPQPGRAAVTGNTTDSGRFKTPTLRGIGLNAPYMHDGSLATLSDVLDFYARGGEPNSHLSAKLRPLELSPPDREALIAFLESL